MEEKTRITIKQWREGEGLQNQDAFMERLGDIVMDSVAPAMCIHGCDTEPDGKCEHGNPSILLVMGLI